MADRYWVGGTGNWSDDDNHWATTSGGSPADGNLPTSSDNVYFDANSGSGTCTRNVTANCLDFDASASSILTFAGTSTLNIYGNFEIVSGVTWNSAGDLKMSATSGTKTFKTNSVSLSCKLLLSGSGGTTQLLDNLTCTGITQSGTAGFDANAKTVTFIGSTFSDTYLTMNSSLTFYNLTFQGSASKLRFFSINNNFTVSNTLTITGDSVTNRALVKSNTLGTARTITANAVSLTNVDFQDITGAGSATWSGTSIGNALGNSGITFTTSVTRYWVATSGGNWSATSSWSDSSGGSSGSSVPLCHDTVVFDANSISSASQTITADMPRVPALDFTNVANSPTLDFTAGRLDLFGSVNFTGLGAFKSVDPMNFYGRSTHTITLNNLQPERLSFYCYGGTYTFQDNITHSLNGTFFYAGTIDFNDNDFVGGKIADQANGTTVYLGNGEFTLTGTGSVIQINDSTWYPENSSLTITDTSTTSKRFETNNLTWNSLTITGDNVEIQDGGTFNTLNLNNAGQVTGTKFTAGKTFNIANFSTNGSVGSLAKIRSSSTTNATLNYTGTGVVAEDYVDIDYITGSPANTWYVGANSTDGGHNSQIYFSSGPIFFSVNSDEIVLTSPSVDFFVSKSLTALNLSFSNPTVSLSVNPIFSVNSDEIVLTSPTVSLSVNPIFSVNSDEIVLTSPTVSLSVGAIFSVNSDEAVFASPIMSGSGSSNVLPSVGGINLTSVSTNILGKGLYNAIAQVLRFTNLSVNVAWDYLWVRGGGLESVGWNSSETSDNDWTKKNEKNTIWEKQ
jgi:hypothetical protein